MMLGLSDVGLGSNSGIKSSNVRESNPTVRRKGYPVSKDRNAADTSSCKSNGVSTKTKVCQF